MPKLVQEKLNRDRAALREDAVGEQLLALYEAADASGPLSPIIAVGGSIEDEFVDFWSILAKFDEAKRSRGEKRARVLLESIPDLIEKVYARHLRAVWIMSFLAQGTWPSRPPDRLGVLVNQVAQRAQSYPGLVDADAGHIRNAVAHRHAEYLPSKRLIELRNPLAKWQITLTTGALEAKLKAMLHVAMELTSSLRSLVATDAMLRSGMFSLIPVLRDALNGDAAAVNTLKEKSPDTAMTAQLVRKKPPTGTDLRFLLQN
jgi:hypothetical protein